MSPLVLSFLQLLWDWMLWRRLGRVFVCMLFPRSLCSREFWRECAGTRSVYYCPIGTVLEFLQASFSLKFTWWPLRPTTCLSVVSQWVDTPSYMFPPEAEASSQITNVMWWIRMLFHCLESSALPILRLEWANAHIRWRLALWRGVLFTDESRFSLYRADGRLRLWHHMGERFADVNVVD